MTYDTLHAYYRDQAVLPTHGRFQTEADLTAHALRRRQIFSGKLQLPPRLFKGAHLLEFGPDSGENSLVFARWGAECTLFEPNLKAHPVIVDYFERYRLTSHLVKLEAADVAALARREGVQPEYDFVVAEGFIYTVRPERMWIDLFARLLREQGLAVINYCETFGSWMELLTKVAHARVRSLTGWPALETAQKLFTAKWNTIPHMRAFESWVMDVLENPFVRLRYLLEPGALCRQMEAAGLRLYSSWPPYRNGLDVYWHKRTPDVEEEARSREAFLARSRVSHIFGKALFLRSPAPEAQLLELVRLTDGLIDEFSTAAAEQVLEGLRALEQLVRTEVVYAEAGEHASAVSAVRSFAELMSVLKRGELEAIIRFCSHDAAFLRTWGMPYHFAVFAREA